MLLTSHSADAQEGVPDQSAVVRCLLRRTALFAVVSVVILLIWGVASGPTPRDANLAPPNVGLIEGGGSPTSPDSSPGGTSDADEDPATATLTKTR